MGVLAFKSWKMSLSGCCDREMNTMRNVAFDLSAYEVRPAGPPEMHGSGAIVALHIGGRANHEKCGFGAIPLTKRIP
jgi:hypothetical protein